MNIETLDDLAAFFIRLGWRVGKDDTGTRFAEMRVNNKILQPLLTRRDSRYIGNPNGVLLFELGGSISEDASSAIYTLMFYPNKRISDSCILSNSPNYSISKPFVTESDVEEVSSAFIEWGQNFDVEAGLRALCNLPTNSSGAYPARHLAALAACGEVEQLTGYLSSFKAGDRLGFAPYIKQEHIEIALNFAQQRRIDPAWLPKRPKMRV